MPWLLNRISFSAAIIAASIAVHIGFVGAIVLAERRQLPPSELQTMDVDLVKPEELQPQKQEQPKQEQPKQESPKPPEPPKKAETQKPPEPPKQAEPPKQPEPPKQAAQKQPEQKQEPAKQEPPQQPVKSAKAAPPEQDEEPDEKPAKSQGPSGGLPGEGKSKLTPEEIASLRAQIQKCWKLPVGIPGMLGFEIVMRVSLGQKGQLLGEPVLLQAPANERGPILVGIAMTALKECYPFKMPPAKYADWKSLDLKFTATGMAGLGAVPKNLPKQPPQAKR